MSCCAHCRAIDQKFGRKIADSDLRRYRRRGPDSTTAEILAMIENLGFDGARLLDVGGGVGVIALEFLRHDSRSAVLVEAAEAYLGAAREEAAARDSGGRMSFVQGDLVAVAEEVPEADMVTMDRVVCCYPDYQALLAAAARKCRKALAISYPRDRWYVRLFVALQNFGRRLVRDPFRTFVHPPAAMQSILTAHGLVLEKVRDSLAWRVALYRRRLPERASR